MKTFRVGALVGVACFAAIIGCGTDGEKSATVEALNGGPVANAPHQGTEASPGIPVKVAQLLSRMDGIGEGSQARYDEALNEFRASPDPIGTLANVYDQLPANALGARWKVVHAATQIDSAQSIEFLERIAGGPKTVPTADGGGDTSFRMRYTASVGVVQQYAAGRSEAKTAIERLLNDADASIAQLMGVELFSMGKLSDAWRAILTKRGISNNFRQFTDAELSALRTINPAELRHRDGGGTPNVTNVPALPENE